MTCKNKMDLYIYTFLILIIQPFSTGHNNEASMVPKNRSKRYIVFPNNSVMQFAMALALPAHVHGRKIATNSGFLLNIPLPTNASDLRIPSSSRAFNAYRLIRDNVLSNLAEYEYLNFACLMSNIQLLMQAKHIQDNYLLNILNVVLKEAAVFLHFGGNETAWSDSILEWDHTRHHCPYQFNEQLV